MRHANQHLFHARTHLGVLGALFAALVVWCAPASAGDRLLGTWGVSSVEGVGGGGLVPWATIAGTGSADQSGGAAFATRLITQGGYDLRVTGAALGWHDRLELSLARWSFKLSDVVPGKALEMDSVGAKVRLFGSALYDQDRPWPQVSVGVVHKAVRPDDVALVEALGAQRAHDAELYLAATKIWLAAVQGRNLIGSLALRNTRANQFGLLGFGGTANRDPRWCWEGSLGLMITDALVMGVEARQKPNLLQTPASGNAWREDMAWDAFLAWFPSRSFSLTLAWVHLGQVAGKPEQAGAYLSAQFNH